MTNNEIVFACDMSALSGEARPKHIATIKLLFGNVQAIRELEDGYDFQLAGEESTLLTAAEFISGERLCCPFFQFVLRVEGKEHNPWLAIIGPKNVKPFIRAEFGNALNKEMARNAGFIGG